MAGHDQRLGIGGSLLELLQDFDPGHAGHAEIEDRHVKGAFLERLERRSAIGANGHFVAEARQFGAHEFLERLFIVHEQDSQALMRRRGQRYPP
jgi:hypothetical protein